MGSKPKEDPADKKARLRERRLSEIDRKTASEENAAGLTADLRGIYGGGWRPSLPGFVMPSLPGPASPPRITHPGRYEAGKK